MSGGSDALPRRRAPLAPATPPSGAGASLGRSTLSMGLGTIVSRALGVVRTSLLAAAIGATTVAANAFSLGNQLSTLVYTFIAEGLFSAILIPQIMRAYRMPDGRVFLNKLLTLTLTALLMLTILMTVAAGWLVWLYSNKDWPPDQLALATAFAYWCMPQIFFYGLYSVYGQVLNSRGRFSAYMWAPAINNIVSIVGFAAFIVLFGTNQASCAADAVGVCHGDTTSWWTPGRIALLGATATAGVILQAVVLIRPLRKSGFRWRLNFNPRGSGLRAPARMAMWTFGTVAITAIGNMFVTNVTTGASGAANAVFSYASMVYILPHAVVTMSLLTAIFPAMSAAAARGDLITLRRDLSFGMRSLGVFTVFAAALLMVVALPVTRVIYVGNSGGEVQATAQVIVALAPNLVPLGITVLLRRTYYAMEDSRSVFFIQIAMTSLLLALLFVIWQFLDPLWWAFAVAASMGIVNVVEVVIRAGGLAIKMHGIDAPRVLRLYVRTSIGAVASGFAGWGVLHLFPAQGTSRWWLAIIACVAVALVMVVLYVVLLALMRVTELGELLRPVLRRGYKAPRRH